MFQHRPRSIIIPLRNRQRRNVRDFGRRAQSHFWARLSWVSRQLGAILPRGQDTLGQGCRQRGAVFLLGRAILCRQQGAVLHLGQATLGQGCRQQGAVLVLGQASLGQGCRLHGAVLPLGQATLVQGTFLRIGGVSARNRQRRGFRQQGVV